MSEPVLAPGSRIFVAGHRGLVGSAILRRLKTDGTPRKLLDVSRASALGWQARIPLRDGLGETYRWFQGHVADAS